VTATHKISKPALRRMLWHGEDPVYERAGQTYVPMTADRKAALEAEYARHGREHLLRLGRRQQGRFQQGSGGERETFQSSYDVRRQRFTAAHHLEHRIRR